MPDRDSSGIIQNVVSGIHMTGASAQPEGDELNLKDNVRRVAVGSDHGGFEKKEKVTIDKTLCVNCASCLAACKEGAIELVRHGTPGR